MYTQQEREVMLQEMQKASNAFYAKAEAIGCHPFIEFAGLMNEYIKCCQQANAEGIDFPICNKHCGNELPMRQYNIDYINEKLDCIFTGRSVVSEKLKAKNIKAHGKSNTQHHPESI